MGAPGNYCGSTYASASQTLTGDGVNPQTYDITPSGGEVWLIHGLSIKNIDDTVNPNAQIYLHDGTSIMIEDFGTAAGSNDEESTYPNNFVFPKKLTPSVKLRVTIGVPAGIVMANTKKRKVSWIYEICKRDPY